MKPSYKKVLLHHYDGQWERQKGIAIANEKNGDKSSWDEGSGIRKQSLTWY